MGERVYFVGTGNTLRVGADASYTARQRQDGSLANRLTFLTWDYDTKFENAMIDAYAASRKVDATLAREWRDMVRKVRKTVAKLRMDYIFGSRQMQFGVDMMAAGFGMAETESIQLWAKVTVDDATTIKSNL
jgi:hypothetical protein